MRGRCRCSRSLPGHAPSSGVAEAEQDAREARSALTVPSFTPLVPKSGTTSRYLETVRTSMTAINHQRDVFDLRIHGIAVDDDLGHHRVLADRQFIVELDLKRQVFRRTRDACEHDLTV